MSRHHRRSAASRLEDAFFATAGTADFGLARAASIASSPMPPQTLGTEMQALRFTTAKAKFRGLRITETPTGYLLKGIDFRAHTASELRQYLIADNRVQLKFSEDLMSYEPEEGLVNKSKVPLWVLKPSTGGTVSIERVWKAA